MTIHRGFKYRLYPSRKQEETFKQLGGNARFLYNKLLEIHGQVYQNEKKTLSEFDLNKLLPKLKEEFLFLKESYSQSLQQVARNLADGFKRFFKKQNGYPKFKKKSMNSDSFRYPQNFTVGRNSIVLPKLGRIKMKKHRPMKGKPKSITIKQDGDQWFAIVLCEYESHIQEIENPENLVGIDLGIQYLAVLSDGTIVENPKFIRKHERRLKKEHRRLSRKKKGSNNRKKQNVRLCRAYRKLRNARKDFREKTTHHMITKYDGFSLENLNIQGMVKNRKLSKAIHDASWGSFVFSLTYKAEERGKKVIQINRWEPSSQICSSCGARKKMPLNLREYICESCGLIMERDLNAAKNIASFGQAKLLKEAII